MEMRKPLPPAVQVTPVLADVHRNGPTPGCRAVGGGGRAGPRVPEALLAGAGLVPAADIHGHRPAGVTVWQ